MKKYTGSVFRDPFGQLTDGVGAPLVQNGGEYFYLEAAIADDPSSDLEGLKKELEGVRAERDSFKQAGEGAIGQCNLLADWFKANAPEQIGDGGAGDNAIRYLEKLRAEALTKDQNLTGFQSEYEALAKHADETKARLADAEIVLGSTRAALEGTLQVDDPATVPELTQLALRVKGQADPNRSVIPADAVERIQGLKIRGLPADAPQKIVDALR